MNSIGGYFGLELKQGEEYHSEAIKLNLGRTAFEYVLRAKRIQKVFLPYYTCPVMLEPIIKTGITYKFYHIDENLEPVFDYDLLTTSDYFLYTNYFGLKDRFVEQLAIRIENLIMDNAQSFFSKRIPSVDAFYSTRKFFGVADGAYLYTTKHLESDFEQDVSYERFSHLLGRSDVGAEPFYQSYKEAEAFFIGQPIKTMSRLTQLMLKSIDYETVSNKRRDNFNFLQRMLRDSNRLNIKINNDSIPMVYPYLLDSGSELKKKLISNKIFIPTYWPELTNWLNGSNTFESYLKENLVCLPVDQRYNIDNMRTILNLIKNK